ncbi:MAG: hypothetical protein WAX66_03885 [Patescibacteria group bacterium]
MSKFQTIYSSLINNSSKNTILKIKGIEKKVKAMVRLTAKNYLKNNDEYIKIIFEDESFLLAIKNDEEFYYANEVIGHIKEIPDEFIGNEEIIKYKDKTYKLENKNDYQYVLNLLVGSPKDIEGECRFSDYLSIEGEKEFLSLGWLSETNERADINPIFINQSDVELVK